MEDFGHRAEAAGEKLGRDAEAAAHRWSKDPSVVAAGDTAARVWGLLVLAVGLWFFADITLGMDMPADCLARPLARRADRHRSRGPRSRDGQPADLMAGTYHRRSWTSPPQAHPSS